MEFSEADLLDLSREDLLEINCFLEGRRYLT